MGYALLLDIGNTNIKLGIADKHAIRESFSLPSSRNYTSDSLGISLVQLLAYAKCNISEIDAVLASSVVPNLDPLLRGACKKFLQKELIMVPQDLPIPLENHYAEPRQVGADRLVGAYAARMLYPEPESIICIDYGTATTFDCVQHNAYLGGLICPGVLSSATALSSRTAKLPVVSLETNDKIPLPGKSTSVSINHGFIFGFAAMSEGLCEKLKQNLKGPCFVLATGGFAASLGKVTSCFDAIRPDLLLEGLRIMYVNN